VSLLDEKLRCIFEEVGAQVGIQMGDVIRCMIQTEISMQIERIKQLQGVLNGTSCQESGNTDASPPA